MPASPGVLLALLLLTAVVIGLAAWGVGAGRRVGLLREAALVLFAYFAYFAVRGATESELASALEHARQIAQLERALGLFVEPALQAAVIGQHWLVTLFNWIYIWGHWPFIGVVAIWLFYARPLAYRSFRNAFLISGAIGLAFFMAFPMAPPRLAEFGLVDTVVEHSNFYRLLQPPQLTNQYAAFPSLHFGWNLIVGIAIFRHGSHIIGKIIGVALPVLMFASIVLTANHYIIDGLAGAALALIGLFAALMLHQLSQRRASAQRLSVAG